MASGFLIPIGALYQGLSDQGVVGSGFQIYTYVGGTVSSPVITYTDSTLTVQNGNPIVLGANGRFQNVNCWVAAGVIVKLVLTDAFNNPIVGGTIDNVPGINDFSEVDFFALTPGEIAGGITPTDFGYPPGDLRRYGAVGDGATDDTVAIQNAFNTRGAIYIRGGGKFMFTNLTVRIRCVIRGDGPRQSVLRQIPNTTGWALTFETGNPPTGSGAATGDISEGGYVFENWGLEVSAAASVVGLKFGDGTTGLMSEFRTSSFRLENQFSETLGSPPFTTPAGSIGIYLNATGGGTSIYQHTHRNLEIRSFETAVYARGGVNDHVYHGWFINCLKGFDLNTCSVWRFNVSHETHVLNARGWYLSGSISNFQIEGGRWEMPVAGCYGIEFVAGLTGTNFRVNNPDVLITGDGSAIPGLKWTGTPLPDSLMVFYDAAITGPAIIVPGFNQMRLPNSVFLGGLNIGNSTIQLGRNAGGADGFLENDGSNILLIGGNNLRLSGGGTTNQKVEVNNTGVGFQGTAPIAKPTVTGSRGGNAALASLLTTLANYGLIVDGSS